MWLKIHSNFEGVLTRTHPAVVDGLFMTAGGMSNLKRMPGTGGKVTYVTKRLERNGGPNSNIR